MAAKCDANSYHEGTFAAEDALADEALVGVCHCAIHILDQVLQVSVLRLLYLHILLQAVIAEIVDY